MFIRQLEFVFWHRLNILLLGYKYVCIVMEYSGFHINWPRKTFINKFFFLVRFQFANLLYNLSSNFSGNKNIFKGKWKVRLGTIKWLANNHTFWKKKRTQLRRRTEDKHPNKIDVSLVFDVGCYFSLQITPETLSFPSITYPCK